MRATARSTNAGTAFRRRQFLSGGAAALLGALVIPACTSSSDPPGAGTASSTAPGTPTGVPADLALARTAASLEALTIATYDAALNAGQISTPALADVTRMFIDHHRQHLNAMESAVGVPRDSTQPNPVVRRTMIDPVIGDPRLDESKIFDLAFRLEDVVAQTYVFATTQLTKPDLRSTFMTIGSVEARHRCILGADALKRSSLELLPTALVRSDNPLPAGALLG